jgi:hypothetical protein
MEKVAKTVVELKLMVVEQMMVFGLPVTLDRVLIIGEGDHWSAHLARLHDKVIDLNRISALSTIERKLRAEYRLIGEPG